MKRNGDWKQKHVMNPGIKRVMIRTAVAVLLGAALFAGMALAGAPATQPQTQVTAPVSQSSSQTSKQSSSQAPVVNPAQLTHDGDTIGLGQIIRFRVIAASDSAFDQAVKLKVRDAVLDYLRPELQGAASEQAAAALISGQLPGIRQVAQQTVRTAGSDKPVQVFYGVTAFPAKTYGSTVFPAGNYQALKIVIGAGQGKNWWCVLFPPLCYVDLTQAAQDLSGGQQITPGAAGRNGQIALHPRLTTRIGTWFTGARSHALASLFWK